MTPYNKVHYGSQAQNYCIVALQESRVIEPFWSNDTEKITCFHCKCIFNIPFKKKMEIVK